jgi:hypothetical protein
MMFCVEYRVVRKKAIQISEKLIDFVRSKNKSSKKPAKQVASRGMYSSETLVNFCRTTLHYIPVFIIVFIINNVGTFKSDERMLPEI